MFVVAVEGRSKHVALVKAIEEDKELRGAQSAKHPLPLPSAGGGAWGVHGNRLTTKTERKRFRMLP